MKSENRSHLSQGRLYRWFCDLSVYNWYTLLFRPSYARATDADRAFFEGLFTGSGVRVVYDIGADVGDKTEVFSG